MVITASAPVAASAAPATTTAPSAASTAVRAAARSWTCKRWPALSRLPAIGNPMLPSPMKPMVAMGQLSLVGKSRSGSASGAK